MQSPMLESSRHSSPSRSACRPVVRLRGPVHPSRHSKSNQTSPSPNSSKMDLVLEPECYAAAPLTSPEAKKIRRNSLYLTFNAPQVDDYHRAIFLAHPPTTQDQSLQFSGTLFHAAFTSPEGLPNSPRKWVEEVRPVRDVTSSDSLVLLYRIATLDPSRGSVESQCDLIRNVLNRVPLGREKRERILGPLAEGEGNPVLENYDCIIWTVDAMTALADAGIISFAHLGFENAARVMAAARKIAGPADAKVAVGVDFGGLRVVN
ncbi:hypothetical protein BUE80_DR004134 [Diplocarpon rosae]|nr:hypothetical protein BUE80_DR004134 [Diplocarpon rosae]